MVIARIGEVDGTTTELHPGLEHGTMHTVTIQSPSSKRREQSWMNIQDASGQGWKWLVERQKTRQDHQIDVVTGQHGIDGVVERLQIRVIAARHYYRVDAVLSGAHQAIRLAFTAHDHGHTGAETSCQDGLLHIL